MCNRRLKTRSVPEPVDSAFQATQIVSGTLTLQTRPASRRRLADNGAT
ncbi:MAG: hypothetical protein NZ874_07675 [Fimbriimonadales bacterium]|nr:hypothetical protein [Fimbriimonadales bacterium]